MKKERIDKLLVEQALPLRGPRPQALVMAGVVIADEQRVEKPSQTFGPEAVSHKGTRPNQNMSVAGA